MAVLNGVWLLGPDGIPHQVPNNEGVIANFEARGFIVTDLPSHLDPDDEEFQAALAELQDGEQAEEETRDLEPVESVESVEPVAAESATNQKEVK